MSSIHIIAEAGTNHNADLQQAECLVDVAHEAGADSVKFQIIYPEGLYLPKLFTNGKLSDNDVFHKRKAGMLSDENYRDLAAYCREKGIEFSGSIFDRRGLDLLDNLDVPYFKIASCDLNNSPFLMEVAERKRKMIVSTGMAALGEIERAVRDISSMGNNDIVLMHCVSVYPSKLEEMNLTFIETLHSAFGLPIGLSDHTEKSLAAAIAVAKGVSWIEKHFTLDRTLPGFDHSYAMEPSDIKVYVNDIRGSEIACQRKVNKIGEAEGIVKQRARRALYAARNLEIGEVIDRQDILVVRPEGALSPNDLALIIGKRLSHSVQQYEPLSLGCFQFE